MNLPISESEKFTGIGYLVVKVSTARGAIPLENASVNIRGAEPEISGVLFSLSSDSAGLTEKLSLPAPPRSLSESPSIVIPYALYNIDVFKEGYYDLHFNNVAVFDSITSIQPAVMIPNPENRFADNYASNGELSPDDINR